MLYARITEPEKGGVWQAVMDIETKSEAREKVKEALGFDPGARLILDLLPAKLNAMAKEFAYTNISKMEFLKDCIRPD